MSTPSSIHRPVDLYRLEAGLRSAAWTWVARTVASVVARDKARQTLRELSALTDQQLHDIGLRRAELEAVAENSSSFRA